MELLRQNRNNGTKETKGVVGLPLCNTQSILHNMEPFSLKKRRTYFYVLLALFFIVIPFITLYTSGYRIGSDFTIVETGGMYIYSPEATSSIYIDDKKKKETGVFQKDWFVQDVKPGTYTILIVKDGFWPWMKEVTVSERKVAEAIAFLIPKDPEWTIVSKTLEEWNGKATTTRKNPDYTNALSFFAEKKQLEKTGETKNSDKTATTTVQTEKTVVMEKVSQHGRVGLTKEGNRIIAYWLKRPKDLPNYFCRGDICTSPIIAFSSVVPIRSFDFYPGRDDVMLIAIQDGIFAVEIDARKLQNFQPIYKGASPDFRFGDGDFFVKDGETVILISL